MTLPPPRIVSFALLALGPAVAGAQPYAFVSHAADDSVSVIDLTGNVAIGRLPVAGLPGGLALSPDGSRLFVTRAQADAVAAIDTATGDVTFIPSGASPAAVAVNPAGTRAYVAVAGEERLSVVDALTGAILGSIGVGAAPVDVVAAGGRVCVANWGSASVTVVDDATGAVAGTVAVGKFPAGLALRPDGSRLYVASFLDETVTVVDPAALSVVATIPVPGRPRALALGPDRLYVAAFETDEVFAIDTVTHQVVGQAPTGAANPTALLLDLGTERLFVAHLASGKNVTVLDAGTLAPLTVIESPPGAVAISAVSSQAPPMSGARGRALRAATRAWFAPRPPSPRRPARAGAGPTTITDTEFPLTDWQPFLVDIGEFGITQQPVGGNPGAFRQVVHFAGSTPIGIGHRLIRADAVYDPSTQGAISSIDVSWDRRRISPTTAPADESVVITQGGVNYRSSEASFTSATWETALRSGLTALDFDAPGGGNPDFSASGGPIAFGYFRRTPALVSYAHGIDNFQVLVHRGGGASPGVIAFRHTSDVTTDGEPIDILVERRGGTEGDVGVRLFVADADGTAQVFDLSWASGDGAPRIVPITFHLPAVNRMQAAELSLIQPSGGATVDGQRDTMVVFVAPSDWPPSLAGLVVALRLLAAGVTPAGLLLLAGPVLLLVFRRRRALAAAALVACLAPIAGCEGKERIWIESPEMIWNDRIRVDGRPLVEDSSGCVDEQLSCLQKSTDPWTGFHRTRDDEVVSELFPELGADSQTRRLVQSDCLWTPRGQAMRASWEAVLSVDPDQGWGSIFLNASPDMPAGADIRYGTDFYPGRLGWLSACRLTTPYDRTPIDIDVERACELSDLDCPECDEGPYWAAIGWHYHTTCDTPGEVWHLTQNVGEVRESLFEVDLRAAPYRDPRPGHNVCAPSLPFDDPSVTHWLADCPTQEGLVDTCADKCLLRAEEDATLTVTSLHYRRTRALSPSLMTVERGQPRRLVRPMTLAGANRWSWRTPDSLVRNDAGPPDPEAPSLRWVENFTPNLRVRSVRALRIGGTGAETGLAATRLRVLDAVPTTPSVWECAGSLLPDGSRIFNLLDSTACRRNDDPLAPLPATPTYVVANVTASSPLAPAVDTPLVWEVDLPAGSPIGQVYLEFVVENQACEAPSCNALKASDPDVDLGRLQQGRPHRRVVEITNVGPEPLRIGAVRMEAIAGHPDARGDFALELLSQPQPAPLPVDVTPSGEISRSADFGTHPLVRQTTVNGEPAYERTLDQDGARVILSGHALEASGLPRFESHRIVYDDPAADFQPPPSGGGVRRPFAQVAHLRRTLPFLVDPGHSFWVRVTATPRDLGDRRAKLTVGATADSNPGVGVWTSSTIRATGIAGPSLAVVPNVLSLPRLRLDAAGQVVAAYEVGAFVANYGGVDMQRTSIAIAGPDAARFQVVSAHPPAHTIPPGGDEAYTVRYTPSCAWPLSPPPAFGPRQFQAHLSVATNGGVAVVQLRGEHCPLTTP